MTKMTSIIYGVVLQKSDGGQQMNVFEEYSVAVNEAYLTVEVAKINEWDGRVYFSELDYNEDENVILSDPIHDGSELIYNGK